MTAQGPQNPRKGKVISLQYGHGTCEEIHINKTHRFCFSTPRNLISGRKMTENLQKLSKMANQGLENTIKVNLINIQCGPGICHDHYTYFIPCILFLWTQLPHLWPETGRKCQNFVNKSRSRSRKMKVVHFKRGPDNSCDDILSCVLFLLTHSTPFWPKID